MPLRTPPHQASEAGGPIRSDAEAEANPSRINYISTSLLTNEIIGSRHGYGPGLFDIPTVALSTGSFVAPASPSCSPFKYWQLQSLETQQQSHFHSRSYSTLLYINVPGMHLNRWYPVALTAAVVSSAASYPQWTASHQVYHAKGMKACSLRSLCLVHAVAL